MTPPPWDVRLTPFLGQRVEETVGLAVRAGAERMWSGSPKDGAIAHENRCRASSRRRTAAPLPRRRCEKLVMDSGGVRPRARSRPTRRRRSPSMREARLGRRRSRGPRSPLLPPAPRLPSSTPRGHAPRRPQPRRWRQIATRTPGTRMLLRERSKAHDVLGEVDNRVCVGLAHERKA